MKEITIENVLALSVRRTVIFGSLTSTEIGPDGEIEGADFMTSEGTPGDDFEIVDLLAPYEILPVEVEEIF